MLMDKMIMMFMMRWWLIIDNKYDYVADSDDNEDDDDDDDEEQEYGQLCGAFEKYKFGKQSRWQYRLPIIVPSSVQPLHSHLPRKKVIVLMRMIMMIMVMMMVVSLLIMILIRGWQCALCKAVSDSFNLGSKFLPGFLQISVKDFCIARFHFCLLQFVHRAI